MKTQISKLLALGMIFCLTADQVAQGQPPGFGGGPPRGGFQPGGGFGRGGYDRGGDDRGGEDMRSRFMELGRKYRDPNTSEKEKEDIRRQFSEMRERYSSSRRDDDRRDDDRRDDRRDDGRRDDDRSRYDRSRGDSSKSSKKGPALYIPKPHDRISVDMPAQFVEGDGDGDGQIALLEWRQWKPQEVANFLTMDTNKDGFLTARELIIAVNFADNSATTAASTTSSPTSRASVPASASVSSPKTGNTGGEKASSAEARYVFKALDKDNDGKLSDKEWSGSKSIRGGFAKAGIKIKLPADIDTFHALYPPYRLIPQLKLN